MRMKVIPTLKELKQTYNGQHKKKKKGRKTTYCVLTKAYMT